MEQRHGPASGHPVIGPAGSLSHHMTVTHANVSSGINATPGSTSPQGLPVNGLRLGGISAGLGGRVKGRARVASLCKHR